MGLACFCEGDRARGADTCVYVQNGEMQTNEANGHGYGPRVPPVITAAWPASEKSWGTGTAGVGAVVEDIVG